MSYTPPPHFSYGSKKKKKKKSLSPSLELAAVRRTEAAGGLSCCGEHFKGNSAAQTAAHFDLGVRGALGADSSCEQQSLVAQIAATLGGKGGRLERWRCSLGERQG